MFGRHRDKSAAPDPDGPRDPDLPTLSQAQAGALHQLVLAAFAGHGVTADTDGTGVVHADFGGPHQFGLHNLAVKVAAAPWRSWPDLVGEHVAVLLASVRHGEADEVRDDMLLLKLRHVAELPVTVEVGDESFLPGLVVLPAVDYPDRVAELFTAESVGAHGGLERFREIALANLAALPPPHHQQLPVEDGDGAVVHLFTTEDFFGASRALVLNRLLAERVGIERPAHGVVLVVPNRHLLAVHVVEGAGIVPALQLLANLADGQHADAPGPVSPHVYYLPPVGAAEQLTQVGDGGTMSIVVAGRFRDALAELGLLE